MTTNEAIRLVNIALENGATEIKLNTANGTFWCDKPLPDSALESMTRPMTAPEGGEREG